MVPSEFLAERLRLFYRDSELELDHESLRELKIDALDVIYVADKGTVIPKRLARIILYAGPILMFQWYQRNHGQIYEFICKHILNDDQYLQMSQEELLLWEPGNVQLIASKFILLHFSRRIVESVFFESLSCLKTTLR